MEELKQGTRVKYHEQLLIGTGKIVGVVTNDMPLTGRLYIVEPDEKVISEIYHYSNIAVFESNLEVIDEIKIKKAFLSFEYNLNVKDLEIEDGKQFKCFHIELNEGEDNGMYIKLCSWDENLEHKDFDQFIGKNVKITIEEID
jgi:hypothetical protein